MGAVWFVALLGWQLLGPPRIPALLTDTCVLYTEAVSIHALNMRRPWFFFLDEQ